MLSPITSLAILVAVGLAKLTLATPTDEEVCFTDLGNFIKSVPVPAEVEEIAHTVREANPNLKDIPLVTLVNHEGAVTEVRHLLKSDIWAVKNACNFYVYNILQKISTTPCGLKFIQASYDEGAAIVFSHPDIKKVLGYVAACDLVQRKTNQ